MGVETRKSLLPAPTDSPVEQTAAESGTEIDFATDLSRRTDKTSYTIPEDGREITIPAKRRKEKRDESRAAKGSLSQTSLLIEYFEGGKVQARPSVRVKVTPSAARKIKDTNEHITLSESRGGRKPSYTRRISLGPHSPTDRQLITDSADDQSASSYTSAAEESSVHRSNPPVEIDIMGHDDGSDLSRRSADRMLLQNPSEISSMPPDSMLEEKQSSVVSSTTPKNRSRSTSREAIVTTQNTLQAPQRTRSRSISKERLAHMAMEKIKDRSRERGGRHRRPSKTSRSRSASQEHAETLSTPRRRSGKQHRHEDDSRSEKDSSIQSESQFSAHRQSGDSYSIRSGASRSSVNANTKLLETVEHAIRKIVMPELDKVKQEQKVSKSKPKFEQEDVTEKKLRKSSTHSSAPDLSGKPKVVLNRDENDPGTILSGDSVKRKEHRRSRKSDSPRERRSEREMSEETVIHDPTTATKKKSKESQRLRDASAGSSLTAAALQYHDMKHSDSRSTVSSKDRRRRRRSKSHSRSASVAESEDVFKKHDIPPMPLQSDIHSSDITRDSILSSIDTEGSKSPAVEVQKATVRQLARASPREISSPGTRTPTKGQNNLQKKLGTHHKNASQEDLSQHSPLGEQAALEEQKPSIFGGDKSSRLRQDDFAHYTHDSRALSPIQSVSSRQESEVNRESYLEAQRRRSAPSLKSETSLASHTFDRTTRPKGIHMESREEVLSQHRLRELNAAEGDDDDAVDEWLQREHEKNDEYRSSIGDPTVDYRHMTNYTDDSMDAPFLDRIAEGQMQRDVDARKNPDYRGTPHAVESAVASLLDTSVISNRSKGNDKSFIDSPDKEGVRDSTFSASREVASQESLKVKGGNLSPQKSFLHDMSTKASPRQSIARSDASEPVEMSASGVPVAEDPMPAPEGYRSESDISTNPSIIRGPMAGTPAGNRDHWPYKPTPPQAQERYLDDSKRSSAQDSLKARAADLLNAAKLANKDKLSSDNMPRSKEWSVDDGYEPPHVDDDLDSYADERDLDSPAQDLPQQRLESPIVAFRDAATPGVESDYDPMDPFTGTAGHARHLSTNSGLGKGMGSPLYDSATGNGLDRIKSKDIVALMDHLTVRDSQRNARDTEILVTLVRSAAEMRNSFEDMKKLVSEQGDILVEAGNKQHDRTINKLVLGGPRPPPPNFTRRSSGDDGAETPTKRQNVFRRALKGMSSRNQNDVSRIEDMLAHLLSEVETLKAAQGVQPLSREPSRAQSLESYHKMRATDPEDYSAHAQAGSPSGGRSGLYPNSPGRGPSAVKPMVDRQASANRVSTVLEADEELSDHEQRVLDNQFENNEQMLTPTKDRPFFPEPGLLDTPPQARLAAAAANATTTTSSHAHNLSKSVESTPKSSNEKSRKHKSTSSSIFPKVSRWSRTTASSLGEWRNSAGNNQRKERPLSDDSADLTVQREREQQQQQQQERYVQHPDDRLAGLNGSMDDLPREDQDRERYLDDDDGFDDDGNRPLSQYDDDGRPLSQYDDNGRPLSQYDDNGRPLSQYDDNGRPLSQYNDHRPPSPLVPSQVSEDPKYQAHRDSLNLQHPQPRPGPTHRYQRHLESQAQNYNGNGNGNGNNITTSPTKNSHAYNTNTSPSKNPRSSTNPARRSTHARRTHTRSPLSPNSDTFGSDPTLARFMPGANARFSVTGGHLSPISDSDAGWSVSEGGSVRSVRSATQEVDMQVQGQGQAQGPPRPPKIRSSSGDEGPLVPTATLQVQKGGGGVGVGKSPLSRENLAVEPAGMGEEEKRWSGVSASEEASRIRPRTQTPKRKPTGPRPIVGSGSYKTASPGESVGAGAGQREGQGAGEAVF